MSTIKMQQTYLSDLKKNILSAADYSDTAATAVTSAIGGLSSMEFSGKGSSIEELMALRKRLSKLYNNGNSYAKIIDEYSDSIRAIDDSLNETSEAIIGNSKLDTSNSAKSSFSFSSATKITNQAITAALFIANPILLGVLKLGKSISSKIKCWFGELTNIISLPNASSTEPSYITNPKQELSLLTENILNDDNYVNGKNVNGGTLWNFSDGYIDGNGKYQRGYTNGSNSVSSVSCVWFAKAKLETRGINLDGPTQYSSNTTGTFGGAVDFIKKTIEQNKGEALYNIYIEGDTSGANGSHTALVDKAYIDSNGKLHLIFSDNCNAGADNVQNILFGKTNGNGGTRIWPFLSQTEYVESELTSWWLTPPWSINNPVKIVRCYGLSQE